FSPNTSALPRPASCSPRHHLTDWSRRRRAAPAQNISLSNSRLGLPLTTPFSTTCASTSTRGPCALTALGDDISVEQGSIFSELNVRITRYCRLAARNTGEMLDGCAEICFRRRAV